MSEVIAITCGDPAGVGPEIIENWLGKTALPREKICVIGPESWLRNLEARACIKPVGESAFELKPGEPSEDGARIALEALEEAAVGCREGRYGSVVTAPVSKAELVRVGYAFPGQTEFFAERWGGEPTMAFAGGRLAVVLATWHIPLMQVASALTTEAITRAVERAYLLGCALGASHPRIGFCGLNPHAGEGGILGTEERDHIDPVLDELRTRFPGLSNALPGDTVFRRQLTGEFDVVVALYHDQGLAPLKTLEFDQAVNITLGLPWIRTSPDHGTAFGIAGKGVADACSFTSAVDMAIRLMESLEKKD